LTGKEIRSKPTAKPLHSTTDTINEHSKTVP